MAVNLGEVCDGSGQKSREVRLGLVMYGGVSLAIYINGVAREFFRAVHGNGVYKLLKRLIDSDIVVDIISGTSAGGINGVFLAYALLNGKDFKHFANLWRESGDLGKLLRDPRKAPEESPSLIDSEGYYQPRLQEAFGIIDRHDYDGNGDEPSCMRELDLFITSTNYAGNVWTVLDDFGHAIDVKDHRTVFQLKHRYGRKEPFNADFRDPVTREARYASRNDAHEAFAILCRSTSCIPAVFRPVEVPAPSNGDRGTSAEVLREWGALDTNTVLFDGGVLDNKPFTYAIRDMATRTKDRPIERILFYVEPDPEKFAAARDRAKVEVPKFLGAALAGAYGIPSYESIADDLRLLAEYNSRVEQYLALCGRISPEPQKTRDPIVPAPREGCECETQVYRSSRFAQISDRAIRGILRSKGRDQVLTGTERSDAEALIHAFNRLSEQTGDATLRRFDVYYRQRRLQHLAELLQAQLHDKPIAWKSGLLQNVNRSFKLLEIFRFWMEKVVDEFSFAWTGMAALDEGAQMTKAEAVWHEVAAVMQAMLDPAGFEKLVPAAFVEVSPFDQQRLNEIHAKLRDRFRAVLGMKFDKPMAEGVTLLAHSDQFEESLVDVFTRLRFVLSSHPDPAAPALRAAYFDFIDVDTCLFALQYFSGIEERERIKIARISPADGQRGFSARPLKDKVAGDELGHFAGFLKKGWRSNDIMWGRLDSIGQIVECLLTPARLTQLSPDALQRLKTIDAAFLQSVFPHATTSQVEKIADWVARLADQDPAAAAAPPVDRLTELAQIEVLHEEVPTVITDSVTEEQVWRTPGLSETEAAAHAADDVRKWRAIVEEDPKSAAAPMDTRIAKEFTGYNVGTQTVFQIPAVVRLDLALHTARVVRNALIGSLPDNGLGKAVRGSRILRLLAWPVNLAGDFFHAARRDPQWITMVLTAICAVSIAAMVFGIAAWSTLIRPFVNSAPAYMFRTNYFVALFVIPFLLLLFVSGYLWLRATSKSKLTQIGNPPNAAPAPPPPSPLRTEKPIPVMRLRWKVRKPPDPNAPPPSSS